MSYRDCGNHLVRALVFSFSGPLIGTLALSLFMPGFLIAFMFGPIALLFIYIVGLVPSLLITSYVMLTKGRFSIPLSLFTTVLIGAICTAGWLTLLGWKPFDDRLNENFYWHLVLAGAVTGGVLWSWNRSHRL